ncbi:CGNR zinc finger domain-containing protein [Amycolatopsis magusensis]|uniref:CGNR zinc finger domain-containing protein n=1 Tax=Amycolatopsis magusensis TaxID=882444 RepID=UPI003C2AAD5B
MSAELPLLGEPASVEFANTLYGELDFLADPETVRRWVAEVLPGHVVPEDGLIELRNGVRRIFLAVSTGSAPDSADVRLVNECATAAPSVWQLTSGATAAQTRIGDRVLLAELAEDCARVVASADVRPVRLCESDDCPMLFVRKHHRRRWCHNSCGHRARQAAYYRRTQA